MFDLFDFVSIETESPLSDILVTEEQSTLTSSPSIFMVSFLIYGYLRSGKLPAAINSCYRSVQFFFILYIGLLDLTTWSELIVQQITVNSGALPYSDVASAVNSILLRCSCDHFS